jgi:hypothetical protein
VKTNCSMCAFLGFLGDNINDIQVLTAKIVTDVSFYEPHFALTILHLTKEKGSVDNGLF